MAELLLRYLAIAGLCFWMGGFTFYAGVVIHVGHRVLGGQREIGFLTREVTLWLNRSGVLVLILLAINFIFYSVRRNSILWGKLWGGGTLGLMIALQIWLIALHPQLDQLLNVADRSIVNRAAFHSLHLLYMNLSTVQWAAALAHLAYLLSSWRSSDRCNDFWR